MEDDEESNDSFGSEDSDPPRKLLPRPWRPTPVPKVTQHDQDSIHEFLRRMIIIDERPLDTFEKKDGLLDFMLSLNPNLVNRRPVNSAEQCCLKIYLDEKKLVKSYFEKSRPKMSLGINTWVSWEGITYLCLSGHFVDENWEMNRMVLNLIQCSIDEVEEATKCVEDVCLKDWGIDQVFVLTINYKPHKSAFVNNLGERFVSRNEVLLGGKYLHLRCLTTIINRVAGDELIKLAELVDRVRELVSYFWHSEEKREEINELAQEENVKSDMFPFLDTPDRWHSVGIMLESAARFESLYEKYAESDGDFEYAYENFGLPTKSDWTLVRALSKVLRELYELRCRVSGSNYYSSNATAFFHVLNDISGFINEWAASDDIALATIACRIKSRCRTYLGVPEKMNAMYVVVVLDPRYKLEYVLCSIKSIFEGTTGENVCDLAKKALFDLFEEYSKLYSEKDKSELDIYLSENVEIDTEDFEVLEWWKMNGPRFPVVARMARDLFAMPISTVAFESDFSTGGVLSAKDYRYKFSRNADMMQALVCASDWLRDKPKNADDVQFGEDSDRTEASSDSDLDFMDEPYQE